jgi:hypothetical protein
VLSEESQVQAVVELRVEQLRGTLSPRGRSEDVEHARSLAENFESLPPILVHSESMLVIDGAHRVLAARLLHQSTIRSVLFAGDALGAFAEAIRRNVAHGKPLTLSEREHAASELLQKAPAWSDRKVATTCGLSPSTVGRLRTRIPEARSTTQRLGRDGRVRSAPTRHRDGSRAKVAGSRGEATPSAGVSLPAWQDHLISVGDVVRLAESVPLGYVYDASVTAKAVADTWLQVAAALEDRAREER